MFVRKVPVVILLAKYRETERTLCRVQLPRAGFVRDEDFYLFSLPDSADEAIFPEFPQLLVVDMVNGSEAATDLFVRNMLKRNRGLKAALFREDGFSRNPYDFFIKKGVGEDFTKDLVKVMQDFINKQKYAA